VKLIARPCGLLLANPWKIASSKGSGTHRTVIVELTDDDGIHAIGEAAPSSLYRESVETVLPVLEQLDVARLSFADVAGSMAYLETIPAIPLAAKCMLNLALLDGAAKRAGKPLYDHLGLGFRERHHVTSFSIGIDAPDIIRKKSWTRRNIRSSSSRSAIRATRRISPRSAARPPPSRCGWMLMKAGRPGKKPCG